MHLFGFHESRQIYHRSELVRVWHGYGAHKHLQLFYALNENEYATNTDVLWRRLFATLIYRASCSNKLGLLMSYCTLFDFRRHLPTILHNHTRVYSAHHQPNWKLSVLNVRRKLSSIFICLIKNWRFHCFDFFWMGSGCGSLENE